MHIFIIPWFNVVVCVDPIKFLCQWLEETPKMTFLQMVYLSGESLSWKWQCKDAFMLQQTGFVVKIKKCDVGWHFHFAVCDWGVLYAHDTWLLIFYFYLYLFCNICGSIYCKNIFLLFPTENKVLFRIFGTRTWKFNSFI